MDDRLTLKEYLENAEVEEGLISVFEDLFASIKEVAQNLREGIEVGQLNTENVYGEQQMAFDVVANNIINEAMHENDYVSLLASEEMEDEQQIEGGDYGVVHDPLDGSSLIDVNLAVGSVFGIYYFGPDEEKTFIGKKGSDQVGSMIATYGPRTTVLLTVREGVVEFLLDKNGKFYLNQEDLVVEEGKMFAPGNLRATASNENYMKLVQYWMEQQYTLRYSGGMVPDVAQIILKGKGIFTYPGYEDAPDGKLRLLFECAPVALLMEEAGGSASDGKVRILEKEINSLEDRSPILVGSKEEVERAKEYLS